MRTIYKFTMIDQFMTFHVPKDSKVLDAALQEQGAINMEEPVVWLFIEDDCGDHEKRTFAYFMTGHMIPDHLELKHIRTVTSKNGIVIHIFEVINE